MKKLLLLASNNELKKVFKLLHKLGCIEIKKSQFSQHAPNLDNYDEYEILNTKIKNVDYVLSIYKKLIGDLAPLLKKEKIKFNYGKRDFLAPTPELDFEAFYNLSEKENELEEHIKEIKKLDIEHNLLKTENAKLKNEMQQLAPFKSLNEDMSLLKDTLYTNVLIGQIPFINLDKLSNIESEFPDFVYSVYGETGGNRPFVCVFLKENKSDIMQKLSTLDFTETSFDFKNKPLDRINEIKEELIENLKSREAKLKEIIDTVKYIEEFRLFSDYYNLQKKVYDYESMLSGTQSSFLLEAWVPVDSIDSLMTELDKTSLNVYAEIQEITLEEEPPVLTKHNAFVKPFESVTNLLSPPRYYEVDPTLFVSIFFFFMAGIMISDFGYGLVITLASLFVLYKKKYKHGKGNLVKLLALMGVSGMIWGILFGTYFGFTSTNENITQGIIQKAVLFDILEKPLPMMALGLGIGVIHILFGISINAYALAFKRKKYIAGIIHWFAWHLLVVGVVLIMIKSGYSIVSEGKVLNVSPTTILTGKILALIGVVLLALDGAIGKKGVGGKLAGGFAGVYGIINLLADVLSYSRLFGLGLASAVVGFVFNNIGAVLIDLIPYVGWIVAILFFIAGHLFNIAIGTLGAYVHGARLEFVEFFGKFYEGGGKLFKPHGSDLEYFELKR